MRFTSVLRASRCLRHILVLCRGARCANTPPFERLSRFTPGALAPARVILSLAIVAYRPHPSHFPAQPDFTAVRLIRAAFAVYANCAPRRPMSGSALSLLTFLPSMSSSMIPENPSAAHTQFLHRRRWPSSILQGLGTLDAPTTIRFQWDPRFRDYQFAFATTC